jgi:beta-1,4-mannosyltransferase
VHPLVVLQSFPAPRPTSVNPYTKLLSEHVGAVDGVSVRYFSWRTALAGRYDVFHAHWPEILVDGHSPLKKLVRQAFTLALLARLRLTRTPIVRTVHNVGLPSGISRRERALLRLFERQTTLRIRLNPETPVAEPSALIPHGHYRDWFAGFPRSAPVDGQLGYAGRIRRYKGVETLIEAFRGTVDPGLSLRVGGYPSTAELADAVTELAAGDGRIRLELGFISDAALVDLVTSSEVVVLPYQFMHNSAAALTALSLDRPVLVPANEVNARLAAEVGDGWVHSFEGTLSAEAIGAALAEIRRAPADAPPRLDAREWPAAASAHVAAYRVAVAALGGRR